MVVKAIINAIGKGKAKPVKFPDGTKFTKYQSQTLLQDAQIKIEKINAGDVKSHTLNGCIFMVKREEILISKEKRGSPLSGQNFKVILKNKNWPKLIEHY